MDRRKFLRALSFVPIAIPAAIAAPLAITARSGDSEISWSPTRVAFKSQRIEIDPRDSANIRAEQDGLLAERIQSIMRDPRLRFQ